MGWKLAHSQFSDVLLQMQRMTNLVSESHVGQLMAANKAVQKEKVLRMLVEAQLHEHGEMQAAHSEAFRLLDQKHQDLRQRYIELCSTLDGCSPLLPNTAPITVLQPTCLLS